MFGYPVRSRIPVNSLRKLGFLVRLVHLLPSFLVRVTSRFLIAERPFFPAFAFAAVLPAPPPHRFLGIAVFGCRVRREGDAALDIGGEALKSFL